MEPTQQAAEDPPSSEASSGEPIYTTHDLHGGGDAPNPPAVEETRPLKQGGRGGRSRSPGKHQPSSGADEGVSAAASGEPVLPPGSPRRGSPKRGKTLLAAAAGSGAPGEGRRAAPSAAHHPHHHRRRHHADREAPALSPDAPGGWQKRPRKTPSAKPEHEHSHTHGRGLGWER